MSAEIPAGAMRFNSDSQKLEYWNGSAWFQVHTATPNLASAGDREPGARGLLAGGYSPSPGDTVDRIDYINIASTGNSQNFGDLVAVTRLAAGCASATRGIFAGGASPAPTKTNKIDLVTIASNANAVDFGNLNVARNQHAA